MTAIADAQGQGVAAVEEGREGVRQLRVEQDRPRPDLPRPEGVAVAEATTGNQRLHIGQPGATVLQVGHVDIAGFEAGEIQHPGHFKVRDHTLLPQDGHAGPPTDDRRRLGCRLEGEVQMQTGIVIGTDSGVLGVSAGGIVAQAGDAPADAVPLLLQLGQGGDELPHAVVPDLDGAVAVGAAHPMAVG